MMWFLSYFILCYIISFVTAIVWYVIDPEWVSKDKHINCIGEGDGRLILVTMPAVIPMIAVIYVTCFILDMPKHIGLWIRKNGLNYVNQCKAKLQKEIKNVQE